MRLTLLQRVWLSVRKFFGHPVTVVYPPFEQAYPCQSVILEYPGTIHSPLVQGKFMLSKNAQDNASLEYENRMKRQLEERMKCG